MHLLLSGKPQSPPVHSGELLDWLTEIPARIGMTGIMPAQVVIPEEGVLIGIRVIAESHISVHLNYVQKQAYVDVFTCKVMDIVPVRNFIIKDLRLTRVVYQVLERGLEYYDSSG